MVIMDEKFDIQEYMTRGVERVVTDAMKATLKDPRESAFMVKFASAIALSSDTSVRSFTYEPFH